jgi:hypothetical protein
VRLVLLHALPFDGRMWRAERDLVPGATFAPSLYRLGSTLEEWARGVLASVGDDPLVVGGGGPRPAAPTWARSTSIRRSGPRPSSTTSPPRPAARTEPRSPAIIRITPGGGLAASDSGMPTMPAV